jgi:hypothetical protein
MPSIHPCTKSVKSLKMPQICCETETYPKLRDQLKTILEEALLR